MCRKSGQASRWMAIGVSCLAFCLSVSSVALAMPVQFQFGGIISGSVNPQLNPPVAPNTPFTGSYTFESATSDLFPSDSQFGRYLITGLSINLAGKTYSLGTPISGALLGVIDVFNTGSTSDSYAVRTVNLTGDAINGSGLVLRQFQFSYSLVGMFNSDALPLVPPPLPSGPSARPPLAGMTFVQGSTGAGAGAEGTITSLTLAPVPLPGALLLFGSGLLGLMGISVGRRMMARIG